MSGVGAQPVSVSRRDMRSFKVLRLTRRVEVLTAEQAEVAARLDELSKASQMASLDWETLDDKLSAIEAAREQARIVAALTTARARRAVLDESIDLTGIEERAAEVARVRADLSRRRGEVRREVDEAACVAQDLLRQESRQRRRLKSADERLAIAQENLAWAQDDAECARWAEIEAEMDKSEEALLAEARHACPSLSKALDLPGYKILGHPYLFMLLYAVVGEDPIAVHELDLILMEQEGSCCTNGHESFEGWCADCLACACEEWLRRKWEARNG